jgi:hypothetical protein
VTDIESEPPDGADHRSAGALTTVSGSRRPTGRPTAVRGQAKPVSLMLLFCICMKFATRSLQSLDR